MNPQITPSSSRPAENSHESLLIAAVLLFLIAASLAFWSYPLLTILSIFTIWLIAVTGKNLAKAWAIRSRHVRLARHRQEFARRP